MGRRYIGSIIREMLIDTYPTAIELVNWIVVRFWESKSMYIKAWKGRIYWVLLVGLLTIIALIIVDLMRSDTPGPVLAHSGDVFGPACGIASLDGVVDPAEWSSASTMTFTMINPGGGIPFNATLYVMNSRFYLYLGVTINDDEFSTSGQYLPKGDGFRIDFDNDNSGSLFALKDDVLGIFAGFPQFEDNFIDGDPAPTSSEPDTTWGGSTDGMGAARRVGNLNHFELRHPLCSGDILDFCLNPDEVIGFRLEHFDAEADGSFGSVQLFPDTFDTSEADIVIGHCPLQEEFINLPLILR